jgi:hypothetical protein
MLRISKRILKGWGRTRADMAPGCPEKLDFTFLKWSWNYFKDQRPGVMGALNDSQLEGSIRIITLKRPSEVRIFQQGMANRD